MKKGKKLVAVLLCISILFSLAITAFAADTRAAVSECPKCGGVAIKRTTRTYEHDETFSCTHYAEGSDIYSVYHVKTTTTCRSCDYSYVSENYEEHVFAVCKGHD